MRSNYLIAIVGALLLGGAWLTPLSLFGAVLGWGAAALLAALLGAISLRGAYLFGFVSLTLGFHWLYRTIADFGGFSPLAAGAIFALYVAVSALQFPLATQLVRALPSRLDMLALRVPLAWASVEVLAPRIFPWQFGHTQIAVLPLAQIADLAGVTTISFLMLWVTDGVRRAVFGAPTRVIMAPLVCGALAIAYGTFRISQFEQLLASAPRQEIALVQANVSIQEKHDIKFFARNTERYIALSETVARPGLLIVWPETVITEWVHTGVGNVRNDPRLPVLGEGASLLTGSLTFDTPERYYNSALAVTSSGAIPYPYHKRILMPFGEYTPFGSVFPWLKRMNATAGDFTAGESVTVFRYPIGDRQLGVAPLICYEDIIPGMARSATREGAALLVNLTNDAWFGHTAAPYQHHMIAAFRAIENRRTLLRSTNSGLTAVVDPLGRTVAQLPIFSDGVLEHEAALLTASSLYRTGLGEIPWWVLAIGSALFLLRLPLSRRR